MPSFRQRCRRLTPLAAGIVVSLTFLALTLPASKRERAAERYKYAKLLIEDLHSVPKPELGEEQYKLVIEAFRKVHITSPASSYCDDALLTVARLYHEMMERFGPEKYRGEALRAYRFVIEQYPHSKLLGHAREAIAEIESGRLEATEPARPEPAEPDAKELSAEAAPSKSPAAELAPRSQEPSRAPAAAGLDDAAAEGQPLQVALPADGLVLAVATSPPPRRKRHQLARVEEVRFWTHPDYTRAVIEVEDEVQVVYDQLADPSRLYFDLFETRLGSNLDHESTIEVDDPLIRSIRVARNRPRTIRIVFDLRQVVRFNVSWLANPRRFVVEMRSPSATFLYANAGQPASPPQPARELPVGVGSKLPSQPAPPTAPAQASFAAILENGSPASSAPPRGGDAAGRPQTTETRQIAPQAKLDLPKEPRGSSTSPDRAGAPPVPKEKPQAATEKPRPAAAKPAAKLEPAPPPPALQQPTAVAKAAAPAASKPATPRSDKPARTTTQPPKAEPVQVPKTEQQAGVVAKATAPPSAKPHTPAAPDQSDKPAATTTQPASKAERAQAQPGQQQPQAVAKATVPPVAKPHAPAAPDQSGKRAPTITRPPAAAQASPVQQEPKTVAKATDPAVTAAAPVAPPATDQPTAATTQAAPKAEPARATPDQEPPKVMAKLTVPDLPRPAPASPPVEPVQAKETRETAAPQTPDSEPAPETRKTALADSEPTLSTPETATLPPPRPASATSLGKRNLTRALGLKISRVVIDPGHGGHDTGSIGPSGLREKDLVLDIALRLGEMIERGLGSEVIYTRTDDRFISLRDRTRLANDSKADLFISLHANSWKASHVRGIETYYLNFTTDSWALTVASRENAASDSNVHELQDLLSKIALKEKVEESREFATRVQHALLDGLSKKDKNVLDRGVRKAPFMVLIGAKMPAILSEIGYLSNPATEKLFKGSAYRKQVAEHLYQGVVDYSGSLSVLTMAQQGAAASGLD